MRKSALSSVLIKIANTALGFLVAIVLARALGPSGYGVYAVVFATVSILAVPAQFGIPQLIVRETARATTSDDFVLVGVLWKWSAYLVGSFSLALAGLAIVVGYFFRNSVAPEYSVTFVWGFLLLPLIALGVIRGAALRGLGYVLLGQLPDLVLRPIFLLTSLLFVLGFAQAEITPGLAMGLHAIAAFFTFVIGAWLLWRRRPPGLLMSESISSQNKRDWLNSMIPLAVIGGLHIVNNQFGLLLVGFFREESEVGIYRVAMQLGLFVGFGLQAVNMVIAPQFSKLYREGNRDRMQQIACDGARLSLLIALPIGTLFIVAGSPILEALFGSEYTDAHGPLILLAIGQILSSTMGSVGLLLNMTGHETRTMRAVGGSVLINIGVAACLIPYVGIYGAAAGSTVALIAWNFQLYRAVKNDLGISSHAFT